MSSTVTSKSSGNPMAVKLRDSCHACASSKLRCSKEKPTCSRCAKRGKPCQYFATRRAGRKQAPKGNTDANDAPAVPSLSSTSTKTNSDASSTPPPAVHTIQVFFDQYHRNYAKSTPGAMGSSESPTLVEPTPDALAINFDGCSPPSMDICGVEMQDSNACPEYYFGTWTQNCLLDPSTVWTRVLDETDDFTLSDVQTLQLSPRPEPMSSASPQLSTTSYPQQQQPPPQDQHLKMRLNGSECDCLSQTLALMGGLFHPPTESGSSSPMNNQSTDSGAAHYQLVSGCVAGTFADSERAIENICTMLQCPCAQDSYILALMSLIVFKVVARYESAARQSAETAEFIVGGSLFTTGNSGRNAADDDNHELRMTAQSILGKLHRVQGLINTISERLKTKKSEATKTRLEHSITRKDREALTFGSDAALPFSATLVDQLEDDLRKRVRTVSSRVVNTLRQL